MKRVRMIARTEMMLMLSDPTPIIIVVAMPIVLLTFLADGLVGGPARSVPGLAALFGFFGLSSIGAAFFRDHGWNTWDRYRMSPAAPWEVVVGKAVPLVGLLLAQQVVVLFLGWSVFGMPWRGSLSEVVPVVVAVVAVEAALGLLLVAACRTINEVMLLSNLGALLLAGMGGALAPVSVLPAWAQSIAPASPVYWAMKGYRVALEGAEDGNLFQAVAVLTAMTLVTAVVAMRLYRFERPKTFFA